MSEPFALKYPFATNGTDAEIYENSRHVVAVDATNPSLVFHNVRNGTDGPAFTVKTGIWGAVPTTPHTAIDYEVMTWAGAPIAASGRLRSLQAAGWKVSPRQSMASPLAMR